MSAFNNVSPENRARTNMKLLAVTNKTTKEGRNVG
jgi:hypothetical protein